MKITVTESMFCDRFKAMRPDNFSHGALCALWTYLEELEQDTGEEIELDAIAICCDWSEYATALEAVSDYSRASDITEEDEALEWLQGETTVLEFDGGIIVGAF